MIAQTAVEPLLDGRSSSAGLSAVEHARLRLLVGRAVRGGDIVRLRVRDLTGQVQFSDDGSGVGSKPEDEALAATHGQQVARLIRLNSDINDRGRRGSSSVEIYMPLSAGRPLRRVAVLELYLPYAPIATAVTAGLHHLYIALALGSTAGLGVDAAAPLLVAVSRERRSSLTYRFPRSTALFASGPAAG